MGQGSELVPGGRISSYLKQESLGAGSELVPEDRISSCLKNIAGQGPSWSQEEGSARTNKKIFEGQGSELVQEGRISSCLKKKHGARVRTSKKKSWGRVRAVPRRQVQLVPQKTFVGQGMSWSEKAGSEAGSAPTSKQISGRVRAGPRRGDQLVPEK